MPTYHVTIGGLQKKNGVHKGLVQRLEVVKGKTCILLICTDQKYPEYEDEAFEALMRKTTAQFKKVIVIVSDRLQRFTYILSKSKELIEAAQIWNLHKLSNYSDLPPASGNEMVLLEDSTACFSKGGHWIDFSINMKEFPDEFSILLNGFPSDTTVQTPEQMTLKIRAAVQKMVILAEAAQMAERDGQLWVQRNAKTFNKFNDSENKKIVIAHWGAMTHHQQFQDYLHNIDLKSAEIKKMVRAYIERIGKRHVLENTSFQSLVDLCSVSAQNDTQQDWPKYQRFAFDLVARYIREEVAFFPMILQERQWDHVAYIKSKVNTDFIKYIDQLIYSQSEKLEASKDMSTHKITWFPVKVKEKKLQDQERKTNVSSEEGTSEEEMMTNETLPVVSGTTSKLMGSELHMLTMFERFMQEQQKSLALAVQKAMEQQKGAMMEQQQKAMEQQKEAMLEQQQKAMEQQQKAMQEVMKQQMYMLENMLKKDHVIHDTTDYSIQRVQNVPFEGVKSAKISA